MIHGEASRDADPVVSTPAFLALVTAATVAALVLRLAAASGDLAIDEVWSLHLIDWFAVHEPGLRGLVALFLHDNTHPLNTLAIRLGQLLDPGEPPGWVYRSLAILSGTLLVPTLACLAPRRERVATMLGCAMLAIGLPLVQYGSEARGYATMLLAALAVLFALARWQAHPNAGDRVLFVVAASLGCLSHLLFLPVLAACGAMAVAGGRFGLRGHRASLNDLLGLFFIPGAIGAAYAVFFIVLGFYGKSEPTSAGYSVRVMAGTTTGFSAIGLPATACVLLALGALAGLALLARRRDPRAIFYAVAVAAMPLVFLGLGLVRYPQPRYFLVPAVFSLLLSGQALAAMIRRAWPARCFVAGAVLGGFFVLQGIQLAGLLTWGRGSYGQAIAAMASGGSRPPLRVGGSQDYRVGLLLHREAVEAGLELLYVKNAAWPEIDWYVAEERDAAGEPLPACFLPAGRFPHAGLSGQTWLLYNVDCP